MHAYRLYKPVLHHICQSHNHGTRGFSKTSLKENNFHWSFDQMFWRQLEHLVETLVKVVPFELIYREPPNSKLFLVEMIKNLYQAESTSTAHTHTHMHTEEGTHFSYKILQCRIVLSTQWSGPSTLVLLLSVMPCGPPSSTAWFPAGGTGLPWLPGQYLYCYVHRPTESLQWGTEITISLLGWARDHIHVC